MTYEIITLDNKNLYFNVHVNYHLIDTIENRKKVHQIRALIEKLNSINIQGASEWNKLKKLKR